MFQISTKQTHILCKHSEEDSKRFSPYFCNINRPFYKAYETSPPPRGDCQVDMSITG